MKIDNQIIQVYTAKALAMVGCNSQDGVTYMRCAELTQEQAVRWLRESKSLIVTPRYHVKNKAWYYTIYDILTEQYIDTDTEETNMYEDYIIAVELGIVHACSYLYGEGKRFSETALSRMSVREALKYAISRQHKYVVWHNHKIYDSAPLKRHLLLYGATNVLTCKRLGKLLNLMGV